MKDFPDFMKNQLNHIDSNQQNTPDIDGYYYEGADGSTFDTKGDSSPWQSC